MPQIVAITNDPELRRSLERARDMHALDLVVRADDGDRIAEHVDDSVHVVLVEHARLTDELTDWLHAKYPAVQLLATAKMGEQPSETNLADELVVRPISDGAWSWRLRCACRRARQQRLELQSQQEPSVPLATARARELDAVARFARGVAHDMNNVLSVIGANAGFLRMALRDSSPDVESALADILLAVKNASQMTARLPSLSNVAQAEVELTSPNRIVCEIAHVLRSGAGPNIELEQSLAAGVSMIRVDPRQLSTVVLNLVKNAADAMPDGGRIRIETRDVELDQLTASSLGVGAGCYACLLVSDEGIGMTPETISRAFEPLFTTKRPKVGTGFGLPIADRIVRSAGGAIDVLSTPGKGSTFRVFIPVHEPATEALTADDPGSESGTREWESRGLSRT